MGGVTGVRPARVLVLGGGIVGTNAAQIAAGMGARSDYRHQPPSPALPERSDAEKRKDTLFFHP